MRDFSELARLQSDFRAAGDLYPTFTIHQKAGRFYSAGPPQAKERFRSLAKFAVDALAKAGIDTGDHPRAEIRFMAWLFASPATTATGAWENATIGPSNPAENHAIESAFYAAADAIGRLAVATVPKAEKPTEKRDWTQPPLDAAIRAEIDKYGELIAAAMHGKAGAKREAKKLFARNTIADRLGVKAGSRNMVTKSKPWQELADAVGLRRKSGRRGVVKVGLPIALEQQADADDSNVAADAIRRETETTIEAAIKNAKGREQKKGLVELLDKYTSGEMTDDQAYEIVATLQGE